MPGCIIQTNEGTDRLRGSTPVYVEQIDGVFLKKNACDIMPGDRVLYKHDGRFAYCNGKQISQLRLQFFRDLYGDKAEDKAFGTAEMDSLEKETMSEWIRETLQAKRMAVSGEDIRKFIGGEMAKFETDPAVLNLFPDIRQEAEYSAQNVLKTGKTPKNNCLEPSMGNYIYFSRAIPNGIKVIEELKLDAFSRLDILSPCVFDPEKSVPRAGKFIRRTGFEKGKVLEYLLGNVEKGPNLSRIPKYIGNSTRQKLEFLLTPAALDGYSLNELRAIYSNTLDLKEEDLPNVDEQSILKEVKFLAGINLVESLVIFRKNAAQFKYGLIKPEYVNSSKKLMAESELQIKFLENIRRLKTMDELFAMAKDPKYRPISDSLKKFAKPFTDYCEKKAHREEEWGKIIKTIDQFRPELISKGESVDKVVAGLKAI